MRLPRCGPAVSGEPFVWTHVRRAGGGSSMHRASVCTPYTAELIADEALRAGCGGVLEVVVAAGDSADAALARVQRYFARLPKRGIAVDVRHGEPAGPEAVASRAGERAA